MMRQVIPRRVSIANAGSYNISSARAFIARIARRSHRAVNQSGGRISKSLGVNSSVTSAAKISAHGLPKRILQTHYCRTAILVRCVAPAKCSGRSIWHPPTLFFQMYGEFFLASLSLKPLERLTGLQDRAQYLPGDAYREQADRFITPYLGIPK